MVTKTCLTVLETRQLLSQCLLPIIDLISQTKTLSKVLAVLSLGLSLLPVSSADMRS